MCLCAGCHMYFTFRPLEWEQYVIAGMGEPAFRALKRRAMAFVGPLDRRAIAADLYRLADERGVTDGDVPGATGRGVRDPGAHRTYAKAPQIAEAA